MLPSPQDSILGGGVRACPLFAQHSPKQPLTFLTICFILKKYFVMEEATERSTKSVASYCYLDKGGQG